MTTESLERTLDTLEEESQPDPVEDESVEPGWTLVTLTPAEYAGDPRYNWAADDES